MSKSEILYVKGMNISESEGDEDGDEDIWDDSKLVDAFDKASRAHAAEVAKRVAMSTNTVHGDGGRNSSKKGKSTSRPNSVKKSTTEKWKVGAPCRAVYECDGLEYEAVISRIINKKECVVRFLGYDNSEIVSISSLVPTLGKDARALQLEQALVDKVDEGLPPNVDGMEFGSDRAPSLGSTDKSSEKKKKTSKKKPNHKREMSFDMPEMPPMPNLNMLRNMCSTEMPIPPPPPLVTHATGLVNSEEQAVSSMLLSWYMSGYYTGLYQGLKRAKESRRN